MTDIMYVEMPNGRVRCWAPTLHDEAGAMAVRIIQTWAWVRNMEATRVHWTRGCLHFTARLRHVDRRLPFRTACLCDWKQRTSTVYEMVDGRFRHRAEFPDHYSHERCTHAAAVKTKHTGEVICASCHTSLGWDSVTQWESHRAS